MKYSKMIECINKIVAEKSLKLDGINVSTTMQTAIETWANMYSNRAPWISNEEFSSGVSASVSSEMSRLVTLELGSEVTGSERADYINEIYQKVLRDLRVQIEYACAKGSMVFKPYPTSDGIAVQYNQADSFFPISFNSNGDITQCAFTEQFTRGKEIFTRVELHTLNGGQVEVDNMAFKSKTGATLGNEIPLESVDQWKDIEPHASLTGTNKLLIGFFKMPLANTIDSDSPMGVSIFSRAIEKIKLADKRYNQIDWEYDAKEAAIHAADNMFKLNNDTGEMEVPAGKKRLYRGLSYSTGATDKPLLQDYSPEIRDQSYINGYNQILRGIEFDCGLAYGTLSDVQTTDKTAEEIRASKQRSYATVSDIQQALQQALTDLVDAIDYWIDASDSVSVPSGEYSVSFDWDDSIITDNELERQQDRQDVSMGTMSKLEYRMKWYGEDEKAAKEALAIVDGELMQEVQNEPSFGE